MNEMYSQNKENHQSSGGFCKAEVNSSNNSWIHSLTIWLVSMYSEPGTAEGVIQTAGTLPSWCSFLWRETSDNKQWA